MKIITQSGFRFLLFVALWLGTLNVSIAQRTITGTVLDEETNEPLIGVTVIEKGSTSNGAISDFDGNFMITVPESATNLVVSYTGYESQEPSIVGTNRLDLVLSTSSVLNEVVVIGYGTVKREDATGAVQSVSVDQFNRGAITGPQELLAGKIAGVAITPDGTPGGGANIRIRGESSLSASNSPLIVIDGVPIENGDVAGGRNALNFINPNDIETFTVLKDASAAAIYGNRASAGVILITTKKGKLGKKIQVGLNSNVSFGRTTKRIDLLDGDEFRALIAERTIVDSTLMPPSSLTPVKAANLLGDANTDWQDEIYRTAVGFDNNLSLSGGIGAVPYRVSLGYTNKEGLLKTDNFKRYTAGVNLNPGFLDNTLQLNLSFKGMLNDNHFADHGAIGAALAFDPTKPVYSDTSAYGGYTTWTLASNGTPNTLSPKNPVALLEQRDDNSTVKRYIMNANVDYRLPFLPDLHANLVLGYDFTDGNGTTVIPGNENSAISFNAIGGGGTQNRYQETKKNAVLESFLNYKKDLGRHDLDLMAGYSWQRFSFDKSELNRNEALTDTTKLSNDSGELFLVSLFGRVNYGFLDRYLFTASIRQDATSRFGPDYRTGLFPALAFAAKLIDRPEKSYLNAAKLRLSWGHTGQQDIGGYYLYQANYQGNTGFANYQFGDEFVNTLRPNGYVANIQWETADTYNAGLDFSIIKNRLSGSVDVYQKNTSNLLNTITIAAGANLTDKIEQNIGSMQTNGFELALLTTPIQKRNFTWDVNANYAWNYSEVTRLINGTDPNFQGVPVGGIAGGVGSNIQNHQTGYQPFTFLVYEQKYDEAGNILAGEFVDRNEDGVITEADKYRYQKKAPNHTFGITNTMNIGNFDFSFAGRASLGNYVYNNVLTDIGYLARLYHPTGYLLNTPTAAVALGVEDQADLTFSDRFVRNAAFFRMDHFTLGYNLQSKIGKFVRIYGTVQNAFLITDYEGLDPEQFNGIDGNVYPRPRTLLVGFSVQF